MSRADLVTLLAWLGVALVGGCIAAWARYAVLRTSADDEVARLRVPVAVTLALVVVLAALVVASPGPTA